MSASIVSSLRAQRGTVPVEDTVSGNLYADKHVVANEGVYSADVFAAVDVNAGVDVNAVGNVNAGGNVYADNTVTDGVYAKNVFVGAVEGVGGNVSCKEILTEDASYAYIGIPGTYVLSFAFGDMSWSINAADVVKPTRCAYTSDTFTTVYAFGASVDIKGFTVSKTGIYRIRAGAPMFTGFNNIHIRVDDTDVCNGDGTGAALDIGAELVSADYITKLNAGQTITVGQSGPTAALQGGSFLFIEKMPRTAGTIRTRGYNGSYTALDHTDI